MKRVSTADPKSGAARIASCVTCKTSETASTSKPTQARIPLRAALLAASATLEQKVAASLTKDPAGQGKNQSASSEMEQQIPSSFNPIVRLEWPTVEKLYIKTAYVRLFPHDVINNFQRWHLVLLSPQAAILK